eukprot:6183018-Heterocapsa_arctica.AAC.1
MDIKHMEIAQRLRESFGYAPGQAVDLGKARRMEMDRMRTEANKEADEEASADRLRRAAADDSKARRDRLAAEE